MVTHHAFPTVDVFSFSMAGAPWTDHEWGSQLLIYLAWQAGGWTALTVVVALAVAGTMMFLCRFLLNRIEPVQAIIVLIITATMMISQLYARPHVFAWLLMAVWVGTLFDAAEKRARPAWWLALWMVLWANMHLSYTLGFAIASGIALDATLAESTRSARVSRARDWAIFLFVCGLGVLINPHGWHAITYTIDVMGMKSLSLVNEWKSANFHLLQPILLWIVLVFGLAFAGLLRLSVSRIILVVVLFYLALKHQRYHSMLGLVSPFVLAAPFARVWNLRTGTPSKNSGELDKVFERFAAKTSWTGFGGAVLVATFLVWARLDRFPPQPAKWTTPANALAAVDSLHVSGNVFNAYNFGGYLIFRGIPVFVDGRSDMYGDSLMQEMSDAVRLASADGLPKLLSRYKITWTMLLPSNSATQLMDRLPEWQRVYTDSVAVVHVRRDALGSAR